MARQSIKLPDYSPDKFVDRDEEIKLVKDRARKLAEGQAADRRTIIFTGERGTGKSWLLAHLQGEIETLPDMQVFSFSLRKYADWEPVLAVADILKSLDNQLEEGGEALGATLAEMSRNLMENVRRALDHNALTLLVDHVYESDWNLLAALEDYLLGPLAVEPRVLIVMAGRGRAYPWKTPELRLKAQFEDLEPFDKANDTAEQLKRQQEKAVSRAKEIHEISGGNPLANYLLATEENPSKALDQVVRGMLETVPGKERQKVREYLEALCVLRAFDEERIPTMLAAYYDNEDYRDWSYAAARQVREALVKWAFAHWSADKGGYVLDELTRQLLERYLETAEHEIWERLQEAASDLYEEWAEKYARTKDRWQGEVDYHTDQLHHTRSFATASL
jgi:hypothetical protein